MTRIEAGEQIDCFSFDPMINLSTPGDICMAIDMDVEKGVKKLKTAARERWGDKWTVEVKHWADGTHQFYAYHRAGRTPSGHLREERLMFDGSGTIHHERLLVKKEQVLERAEVK